MEDGLKNDILLMFHNNPKTVIKVKVSKKFKDINRLWLTYDYISVQLKLDTVLKPRLDTKISIDRSTETISIFQNDKVVMEL